MMKAPLPILITGGAGFVGTNLANHFASLGIPIIIYDNFSRPGVEKNYHWLKSTHPERITLINDDIRSRRPVHDAVRRSRAVFHLAAQVAVTTSLNDPVHDFEVNAWGTLNLLEALRGSAAEGHEVPLIYTSTNKVFGGLDRLELVEYETRYTPSDTAIRRHGIGEDWGIDFCSPYGCSKGAADQYVLDYTKSFGIRATVFRMSCIYGPHQFGTEDQGWVAHFMKEAIAEGTIAFYGDGKQVRDVLFVDDLIRAFEAAMREMHRVSGQAFSIGGGPDRSVSLTELVHMISSRYGYRPEVRKDAWRPADQKFYVSDIRRFGSLTGWSPRTSIAEGLDVLHGWLTEIRREHG